MSAGITVAIPSRDMEPMLQLCLQHLATALAFEREGGTDHVVVVDNASQTPYDAAAYAEQGVAVLRFDEHHCFSACCNEPIRRYPNRFYLMLNNDVILHPRALVGMLAAMESGPRIGAVGARLVYPDGTIQHAGVRFGPPSLGPYHLARKEPSHSVPRETRAFQAVTAACMLLRSEAVDEVGRFDEQFPFAWEDFDLCLRMRQAGWQVVCANDVDSLHFESLTEGRAEMDAPSRELFMKKWAGKWSVDG
jgi:GT2 family glycosyltransferase